MMFDIAEENKWNGAAKIIEESGELTQVLGKLIATRGSEQYWDGLDLKLKLIEEISDLEAALDFFVCKNLSSAEMHAIERRTQHKIALFEKWSSGEDQQP